MFLLDLSGSTSFQLKLQAFLVALVNHFSASRVVNANLNHQKVARLLRHGFSGET